MKKFEAPEVRVILVGVSDILTTSSGALDPENPEEEAWTPLY